jgi:hypothetical protein
LNPNRPEAEIEYSRGGQAQDGDFGGPPGPRTRRSATTAGAVLAGGLLGAVLLLGAEFTPLLKVHSSASRAVLNTVSTGSHNSYALIPIGLLAMLLSWGVWRTGSRLALLAIGMLGVVSLLIALLADLPDAQATGLIGSAATNFVTASSSPSIGLYIETLGAILLLITAASGLLLLSAPQPPNPDTRSGPSSSGTRSAS